MKYQRIEDMRIDQDLTIKEISALLECNRDVYSRYEKGIRDIPIDFFIFVFCVLIRPFGRILYYNGILILRQF